MKSAAKLLISDRAGYLFAGKAKRNGRLEMLGGEIKSGEEPQEALLRELTEEVYGDILLEYVRKSSVQPDPVTAKKQTDYVFRIEVDKINLSELKQKGKETTALAVINRPTIDDKKQLVRNEKLFTPRTWDLFRAMELIPKKRAKGK